MRPVRYHAVMARTGIVLAALLAFVILSLAVHFGPSPPPDDGRESK